MPFNELQSYGLSFLELTFVLVTVMLLHSLKQAVGTAAFYLSLGGILVFSQVVTALGLQVQGLPGLSLSVGPAILFTPFMAALLITYIVDGTLEAQRLIWGMMAVVGSIFYLTFLAEKQSDLPGYSMLFPWDMSAELMASSRQYLLAALLSLMIEFLILPVVYELLRGRNHRLGVSVFGAFMVTAVLDSFFYELVTNYGAENWWDALRQSYLARCIAMLWVSLLTTVYLHLRDASIRHISSGRRPLDIVVAFLGAYSEAEMLRANVREWEGRYRLVVENTSDMIFIVTEQGLILDANRRGQRASGYPINQLLTLKLTDMLTPNDRWQTAWQSVFPPIDHGETTDNRPAILVDDCQWRTRDGGAMTLEVVLTPIFLRQSRAVLVVGRDVTHRKQLERDRQALQEQLVHSQRMEAVGKLAGGIAHDFNNLLHAIQGSIDNLRGTLADNTKANHQLNNISTATDRAARTIGQLLGFARAGKYEVTRIDVTALLRETETLFRPVSGSKVEFKAVFHPDPMVVEGDFTQLEQVVFNMLLNAREALTEGNGRIVLRAEPAGAFTPGWKTPKTGGSPESFVVIRVKDNGSGMDAETLSRIFEPFYTTKVGKGTGMGLAMAYGCIENHHGWIHVESAPGKGTEFFVFLPRIL